MKSSLWKWSLLLGFVLVMAVVVSAPLGSAFAGDAQTDAAQAGGERGAAQATELYLPVIRTPVGPVYEEDFSDSTSGWPVKDDGDVAWSYEAGEYQIYFYNTRWWAGAVAPPSFSVQDYTVEATMYLPSTADSYYGLVYEWLDWGNFKVVIVRPSTQSFEVYDVVAGTFDEVVASTSSAAILGGTSQNQVVVQHLQAETKVLINGVQVASFGSSASPAGFAVGVYGETVQDGDLAIRYDDVTVWSHETTRVALPADAEGEVAGMSAPVSHR